MWGGWAGEWGGGRLSGEGILAEPDEQVWGGWEELPLHKNPSVHLLPPLELCKEQIFLEKFQPAEYWQQHNSHGHIQSPSGHWEIFGVRDLRFHFHHPGGVEGRKLKTAPLSFGKGLHPWSGKDWRKCVRIWHEDGDT